MNAAICCACAAGLLAAGAAAAEDLPLWELGGGVAGLRMPHYRGADQVKAWLLPIPWFVYRGEILRADRDGARLRVARGLEWDVDFSVSAAPPTRSDENRARAGMANLPALAEIGPNLNVVLQRGREGSWELRVPVRAAFTIQRDPRSVGWVAQPTLSFDRRHGEWNLGATTGPVWGSRRYHGFFYDVDGADVTVLRPAYRAPGGAAGWQATLSASRRSGRQWMAAFLRLDTVAGASFESSPLVRRQNNVSFGVAWSWIWAQPDQRVPDPDARR